MALINCPKCGKEISDKAKQCVGCGWEVEAIKDSKKEQTAKLQHTLAAKREKNFLSANILFMMGLVLVLACFMIVVWRRLGKLSAEIEMLKSNSQIESEMLTNDVLNGSENNLEDNNDHGDLEDNNEKEEVSDSDSQNENEINENGQEEETEEIPENVVLSGEDIVSVDNSNLKFEYTGNNVSRSYVTIYFKITNDGDAPIYLSTQKFHFLNDVSIEQAFSKLDDVVLPGKSSLLEICFNREKIEAAEISTIESFMCQYNTAVDSYSENLTPNEITFSGLGINIK